MSKRRQPEFPKSALEERLGYEFTEAALLDLALTHRSFVYESRPDAEANEKNKPGTDNEQLEFLGDAVLGLVVSELVIGRFPDCDEGEMTRIRSSLVSRKRMAELGAALRLDEFLKVGESAERSGVRERPALLANAAEAVLAAMYLDAVRSGKEPLVAVRALAEKELVEPDAAAILKALKAAEGRGALRDPKTLLQERVQAENAGRLRYLDTAQEGPAHRRVFTVEAHLEREGKTQKLSSAEGPSKREAQQRAAQIALDSWISPEATA
jgi:ribonuclease-3